MKSLFVFSVLTTLSLHAQISGQVTNPGGARVPGATLIAAGTTTSQEQTPATPQRIRVGGNVQAVNLITKVNPVYPADMKEQRLEGVVVLQAVISTDGVPMSLNSQSADTNRSFVDAAIDAVRQWRYKPTLLNGQPVEVITTITVNFTLSQ